LQHSDNQALPGFDRLNAFIAAAVFLIAFFVYRATVARTLSYWDCGEFIACAHILGNPHPPGSPFFVIMGRFFDLLPIGQDPAYRINLLSVVTTAVAAMFSYLIVVRMVSSWYEGTSHYKIGRVIAYAAGFVGALFMAFGETNWSSAVEAEVYGLSMMLMTCIFWLAIKWFDYRYRPPGQKIAILIAFLSMLAIGAHLTVFLVVPIVTIFLSLKKETTKTEWMMAASYFVIELLLIIILSGDFSRYKIFLGISGILSIILVLLLRQRIIWQVLLSFSAMSMIIVGFYPFMYATLGWLAISIFAAIMTRKALWKLAVMIVLAGIVGFSIHLYIPVRSTQNPAIDENAPARSFDTFVNFMERKQYGNVSMTERMFVRRGQWANQFGDHARMGFWRFFKEQYASVTIFPLVFLVGLGGLFYMAIKKPSWGMLFFVLVLLSTVGLVLYMNFADGTKEYDIPADHAYQEVRDRDYFFQPAFVIFGMAIGLGIGAIMEFIRNSTANINARTSRMAVALSMVLVLTPLLPARANYFTNDRSRNRMAYNYAYNLLSSCDKDAILFTSGDNDTFPLWCLQQVYGFRKDVRVVNFSLLNTDWYNWQLKHFYDVPISLDDDQILWKPYYLEGGEKIYKPDKMFFDRTRNRQTYLFPLPYKGQMVRVASMMLDEIILTNKWKYPIYFTSSSGDVRDSPLNLLDRCYRYGIVLRLSRDTAKLSYDVDVSDSLFMKVYNYSNVSDTLVEQNENATGIALAYPEKLLDYRDFFLGRGDTAKANEILDFTVNAIPGYWRVRLTERDELLKEGDTAKAEEVTNICLAYQHGFYDHNPTNVFFPQFLGMTYYGLGEYDKAEKWLDLAWEMNKDKEHTFRALMALLVTQERAPEMVKIAQEYLQYQENDPIANQIVQSARFAPRTEEIPQVQIKPPPSSKSQGNGSGD
jgi:hypothetical protein